MFIYIYVCIMFYHVLSCLYIYMYMYHVLSCFTMFYHDFSRFIDDFPIQTTPDLPGQDERAGRAFSISAQTQHRWRTGSLPRDLLGWLTGERCCDVSHVLFPLQQPPFNSPWEFDIGWPLKDIQRMTEPWVVWIFKGQKQDSGFQMVPRFKWFRPKNKYLHIHPKINRLNTTPGFSWVVFAVFNIRGKGFKPT